jgi:hypothetical protein
MLESDVEEQIAAMANDPEMRYVLQTIQEEFAIAEADGLGSLSD